MGTITCTEIINKAATQLLDTANTRWPRTELLGWISDGQRQIVQMQPNASATTVAFPLVAGTRQTLPANGYLLLDIYRNLGTTGTTPGRAIRIVSRTLLDAQDPDWHIANTNPTTKNYVYDVNDKTAFYVYPPAPGGTYIELCYAQAITDFTQESQTIVIEDTLQTCLLDYVLWRACSKDAEYAPGLQLANMYMSSFMQAMGKVQSVETIDNVNKSLGGNNAQPMPGANS
ncbi:DUF6682 family protein [Paraburkholderia unamae]|uniref:DUF6682 family protein n=1 Tax=Paraburkholderia unamae TaxID=219649 RepID=A0ACC6RJ42_9BURK